MKAFGDLHEITGVVDRLGPKTLDVASLLSDHVMPSMPLPARPKAHLNAENDLYPIPASSTSLPLWTTLLATPPRGTTAAKSMLASTNLP